MARYDIINGPSKYDLMLALFERSINTPRPVSFVIARPPEQVEASRRAGNSKPTTSLHVILHITQVGIEDGSGHSYCFEAQAAGGRHFKGWFRTDDCHGTVEDIDDIVGIMLSTLE